MKALVYTKPGSVEFRDIPTPEPKAGEVLVRVASAGICGSDLHAFHGKDDRRPAPLILGHEVSGYCDLGAGEVPVVINPLVTCQNCAACIRGQDNLCGTRQIISMHPRPGSFAEYVAMPVRNVIELPNSFDMHKAALCEPLACGWHAARLAEKFSGLELSEQRIVVLGAGAVGLGSALSARALGCSNLTVAEMQAGRRANAESQGLTAVHPDDLLIDEVDIVIDAVGISPTRNLASQKLRPGGLLVHIGLGNAEGGFDIRRATLQEINFVGSYTYTMDHFREVVDAMIAGRFGALDWFDVQPMQAGQYWFEKLSSNEVAAAKILLEF